MQKSNQLNDIIKASTIENDTKEKATQSILNGDNQLIDVISNIQENFFKATLIRDIFNFCSDKQKNGLLKIIHSMKEDYYKRYILEVIYQKLNDDEKNKVINKIQDIKEDWKKAIIIQCIFQFSDGQQKNILFEKMQNLTDKSWKSTSYGKIFNDLNNKQKESVLGEIKDMDVAHKAKIIQLAFEGANEDYKKILFSFVDDITDDDNKGSVIGAIYKYCNDEQRDILRTIINGIETQHHRNYAEKQLAHYQDFVKECKSESCNSFKIG